MNFNDILTCFFDEFSKLVWTHHTRRAGVICVESACGDTRLGLRCRLDPPQIDGMDGLGRHGRRVLFFARQK